MRPAPLAAGFQFCRPGSVSRAANVGSAADAKREKLSAMPLAVTHLTNSRRDGRMLPPLGWRSMSAWHDFLVMHAGPSLDKRSHGRSASVLAPGPGVIRVGH